MSTHVDGAAPSVAPDPDDGEPDLQSSELDDGSQWVRAEIQRRMAVNRSTRGRHARRGDAAAPAPTRPWSAVRGRGGVVSRSPPRPGAVHRRFRSRLPGSSRQATCPRTTSRGIPCRPPVPPRSLPPRSAGRSRSSARRPATPRRRRPPGRDAGPSEARRCRPPGCRCRSARSAAVLARRCRAAEGLPVRGHGRGPRSSPASPCSGSVRHPGCSAAPNRCPRGGFRRRHRGASRSPVPVQAEPGPGDRRRRTTARPRRHAGRRR